MKYIKITSPDIENGPGFRVTLWISGCLLRCPGCHNSCSHDFNIGKEVTEDTLKEIYEKLDKPYIQGLTLSGGNPLDSNIDELIWIIKSVREKFPEKNILLFSGYELGEILGTEKERVLEYIDYLIDGPFKIKEKDTSLPFRGSRNQIIWERTSEGKFIKSILN